MFIWKEEYLTGIQEIDEQHARFFEMGINMNNIIIRFNDEDIQEELYNAFIDLIEYTIYHFRTEENFLTSINYPNLDQHRAAHHQFVEKLHALDLTDMSREQGQFAFSLLKMISIWITEHIIGEDMRYIDYIDKTNANKK